MSCGVCARGRSFDVPMPSAMTMSLVRTPVRLEGTGVCVAAPYLELRARGTTRAAPAQREIKAVLRTRTHSIPRPWIISSSLPVAQPTIHSTPTAMESVAAATARIQGSRGERQASADLELRRPQQIATAPMVTVAEAQKLSRYASDEARPGMSSDGSTPSTPPGPPTPCNTPTPSAIAAS
eukprot:scaffold21833_cov152-Isochrysis_galbana.AAC.2